VAKSKKKLPTLCAWCKKIVTIDGKEVPISETGLTVKDFAESGSHGICHACSEEFKRTTAAYRATKNPPPWAVSRATWKKAESVVDRSYRGKTKPKEYYAVVADVYQKIGGQIKRKARGNPSSKEWDAVISMFKKFHRFLPSEVTAVEVGDRKIPAILAKLGELKSVVYISDKWDGNGVKKTYIHNFKAKDRPILATDAEGQNLYVVGGSYRIKAEGIVG